MDKKKPSAAALISPRPGEGGIAIPPGAPTPRTFRERESSVKKLSVSVHFKENREVLVQGNVLASLPKALLSRAHVGLLPGLYQIILYL